MMQEVFVSSSRCERLRNSAFKCHLYEEHQKKQECASDSFKIDLLIEQLNHLSTLVQFSFAQASQWYDPWAGELTHHFQCHGGTGIPVEELGRQCHAARRIQLDALLIDPQEVEIVHDPVIQTQNRILHNPVEQQDHCHHQGNVDHRIDIHVVHEQEDIVHAEVYVPMHQEEHAHIPGIQQERRHPHLHVDHHVEVHVPMHQGEHIHVPVIQTTEADGDEYGSSQVNESSQQIPQIVHESVRQIEDSDSDTFHSMPEGAWWTVEDLEELCRRTAEQAATITTERLTHGIESFFAEIKEPTLQHKCQMAENAVKSRVWRLA